MKTIANNPDRLNKEEFKLILENRDLRIKLAEKDPYWFFHLYFSEYIKCPTAPFQKQLFKDLASDTIRQLVVVSFRGSACQPHTQAERIIKSGSFAINEKDPIPPVSSWVSTPLNLLLLYTFSLVSLIYLVSKGKLFIRNSNLRF